MAAPKAKQSFMEKNFPSIAKGKKGNTKSGKKRKSIRDTTKRGKELRKKQEKNKSEERAAVEDPSEVKGYKPTVASLPQANLLPLDSQISIKNRSVRIGFVFMAGGIFVLTVLVWFFTIASTQYSETFLKKAQENVETQKTSLARYNAMQQYDTLIQSRLKLSATIDQALPEYDKILSSIATAGETSGVTYGVIGITSTKASGPAGTGATAAPPAASASGGASAGACGPTNNPFNQNTKPVMGCLTFTGFASNTTQIDQLTASLNSSGMLVDVYITQSDNGGKTGTQQPTTGLAYNGTATIISTENGGVTP